jgi:hypothetical protein
VKEKVQVCDATAGGHKTNSWFPKMKHPENWQNIQKIKNLKFCGFNFILSLCRHSYKH